MTLTELLDLLQVINGIPDPQHRWNALQDAAKKRSLSASQLQHLLATYLDSTIA